MQPSNSTTITVTAGPNGEINPADRARLNEMLERDDRAWASRQVVQPAGEPVAVAVATPEPCEKDHAIPLGDEMVPAPCRYCGKRFEDYLTLTEAFAYRLDYAKTNCLYCQLTDLRRHKPVTS